jgi:cytochrome c oxidase subunit 4
MDANSLAVGEGFPYYNYTQTPMSDQPIHAHGPVVTEGGPMAPSHGIPAAHDVHEHEHGGIAKYIFVFFALCFLTTLSFLTYSDWWRHNFTPAESRMLMMAVSCTKALLVILFFMHILWEANWKFVLTIPAALMSLFLIVMLIPDIGNRGITGRYGGGPSEERQFHQAVPKEEKAKSTQPASAKHVP